jgi:mannose-6-phosphate isomerase-like protein (cupin superfamily)
VKNIKIIKTGIDVTSIKAQLLQYSKDWECHKIGANVESLLNKGYPEMDVGVLQLKIGVVAHRDQFVGDSEFSKETSAWHRHTAIRTTLRKNGFPNLERCGFLSLPIGKEVGRHIDEGTYYKTRNRYHLSIQGKYLYTCGDEETVIEPGVLFWFDNKQLHSATNIGDEVRITFVFDTKFQLPDWVL